MMEGAGGGFAMKADRHRASCAGRSGGGGDESESRVCGLPSNRAEIATNIVRLRWMGGSERFSMSVPASQPVGRSAGACLCRLASRLEHTKPFPFAFAPVLLSTPPSTSFHFAPPYPRSGTRLPTLQLSGTGNIAFSSQGQGE